jgi:hypothetical protein
MHDAVTRRSITPSPEKPLCAWSNEQAEQRDIERLFYDLGIRSFKFNH